MEEWLQSSLLPRHAGKNSSDPSAWGVEALLLEVTLCKVQLSLGWWTAGPLPAPALQAPPLPPLPPPFLFSCFSFKEMESGREGGREGGGDFPGMKKG